jgi:dephospho-CoA kinase
MILGLTGKICSGKNRAASLLQRRGFYPIDVDRVGHEVLDEVSDQLSGIFGSHIIGSGGQVDREVLGSEVFDSPARLGMLEAVLHPKMVERCLELDRQRDRAAYPAGTVFNAAVLHTMGLDRYCDAAVLVKAPFMVRMVRARRDRGMRFKDFFQRNRSQRKIDSKHFRSELPIYVIMNNRDQDWLERQVDALSDRLQLENTENDR